MSNTKKLRTVRFEFNKYDKTKLEINNYEDGSIEEIKFMEENPKIVEYRKLYDDNAKLRTAVFYCNRKCTEIHYYYDPSGRLISATITRESLLEPDVYKMICEYEKDKIIRKSYINGDYIGKEIILISKMNEWIHVYTNKRFASFKESISYDENGEIINISLEPIKDNYKLSNSNNHIVIG